MPSGALATPVTASWVVPGAMASNISDASRPEPDAPVWSLVLVIVRPGAAVRYLEAATAWVRRHDHAVVVGGLLLLGSYLVVKGAVRLLT